MSSEFVAYRKFTDIESAAEVVDRLRQNGIECHLQDDQHQYVKVYGPAQLEYGITVNIKSEDFNKADKILEDYYSDDIANVDKDYYLFEFNDDELKNILLNPYDWGVFDFQLAKKILREKGIEYSDDFIQAKKEEKLAELSKIIRVPLYKIVVGYLLAIVFPAGGLIMGLLIVNNRNILPDGRKVYIHSKNDRLHGQIITGISILWIVIIFSKLIVSRS